MPKHILCADDSTTIQRVVEITFAKEDVRITPARSADDALAAARRERPDVVLADVSMDGKSGYDLCSAIKNDPALRTIPVIILGHWDENRGKSVGADGHVGKPFETQQLLDKVNEIAGKIPAKPATAAAPAPAPAPAAAKPATAMASPSRFSGHGKTNIGMAAPQKPVTPAVTAPIGTGSNAQAATASAGAPPAGLNRPPMIGGAKLAGKPAPAAAVAMAAAPAAVPAPAAAPAPRVATPLGSVKPSPLFAKAAAAPKPAPPPAVKSAISDKVAEKVAQFAAAGPEYAAIAKLSKEIIEQIAWEVVPELAEAIIRSELDRLIKEKNQ